MLRALVSRKATLAVVGLGYVGLPLAVAFSKYVPVIGFDINPAKVRMYRAGRDVTREVGDDALANSSVYFTSDAAELKRASFIVVAVPTPVDRHRNPDLTPVISASRFVGQNLSRGAIVVYESTVFPGVTEEVCLPVLEGESGLKCGVDFSLGYSPERINPGDRVHRLETITKVVAAVDEKTLQTVASVYSLVVEAGVHKAPSVRVAEAAKVIENAQRDLNIAFVNELAVIFNLMDIDTQEVLKAAGTKWNFLQFRPGLVGGHCIGVDPYYLTYKAQELGYHPEVLLAGRRINDRMGKYVAENTVKQLIKDGCPVSGAKVLVMGLTFKEEVPDIRNSKVADIVSELKDYGVEVYVTDPYAENADALAEYGIDLSRGIPLVDAVIIAVAHSQYRQMTLEEIRGRLSLGRNVLIDVKGIFDRWEAARNGLRYWRL